LPLVAGEARFVQGDPFRFRGQAIVQRGNNGVEIQVHVEIMPDLLGGMNDFGLWTNHPAPAYPG
jgi:hypothetical protein